MSNDTVGSLADLVGGRVVGDRDLPIRGVGDLSGAEPGEITFLRHVGYVPAARATRASAIVVGAEVDVESVQVVVDEPELAFVRIAHHLHPGRRARGHLVDPAARVHPDATLEEPVEVGPMAVVGARAEVGGGTVIDAGAVIGERCRIGRDCVLFPRVVLYPGVVLGDRVTVHAGSVIGSDGFGYVQEHGRWVKFPQIGSVRIHDDVEIGANCTVDCGTLGDTVIGRGTKLDNLVHVGHNCVFGADNAIAALCAFAGTTVTGDRVTMAGHTVSAGHLDVADDVRIGGNSVIYRDVPEPGDYMGYPLQQKAQWARTLGNLLRLNDAFARMRAILWGKPAAEDDAAQRAEHEVARDRPRRGESGSETERGARSRPGAGGADQANGRGR